MVKHHVKGVGQMKKIGFKRMLVALCIVAILCPFVLISGKALSEENKVVTFADFGVDDGIVFNDVATETVGSIKGYENKDGLVGKAFEGYITLGYLRDSLDTSVRLFGTGNGGIGVRSRGASGVAVCTFNSNGSWTGDIVDTEGKRGFDVALVGSAHKEFKIYVKIKAFSGNNATLLVKINDAELFNGTVNGLKNYLGGTLRILAATAPVGVRSIISSQASDEELDNITFKNFSNSSGPCMDGVKESGNGYGYHYSDGENLFNMAFTGDLLIGVGNARDHSFRIAGKEGIDGIGFFAKSEKELRLFHYNNNVYDGNSLATMKGKDFGFTNLNTQYVNVEMEFRTMPDTDHIKLIVNVNGKKAYSGIIANGKTVLGKEMLIYAASTNIGIKSEVAFGKKPLTFSDFGINDGTIALGNQSFGQLTAYTGVEGLIGRYFEGYVTLGYTESTWLTAAHVFGNEAGGIGVFANGSDFVEVAAFNTDANRNKTIAKATIKDYNITYTEGVGLSEFKLYVKIKDISGDGADLLIKLNNKQLFDGRVDGIKSLLGPKAFVWAYNAPVTIRSKDDELDEPYESDFTEVSFIDFGVENQIINDQLDGNLPKKFNSMDGLMFSGKIQMELSAENHNQSVRIGTNSSDRVRGIGLYTESAEKIVLYNYTQAYWGNELASITPSDYGISYSEKDGFNEFDLKMFFKFVGEKDLWLTVKINGATCYNMIVPGMQEYMGTHLFAWGDGALISLKSSDNFHVPNPDAAPVITKDFKHISFADFEFEKTTVDINNNDLNGYGMISSLDKVVFSDTICFGGGDGSQWRFGGTDSVWNGIMFTPTANGNLTLSNTLSGSWPSITFISKLAGCKLVGEKVKITMSFEYVDSDNDGQKDDVKFGIWFNDKSYQNRSYYLTDKANELGGHTLLHIISEKATISIDPFYPSLDFGEFGYTKNWAVELGIKK